MPPLASKFPWQSPFSVLDGNPILKHDPNGAAAKESAESPDNFVFNEKGSFERIEQNDQPDKLVVENSKIGARQDYQFADPESDPRSREYVREVKLARV